MNAKELTIRVEEQATEIKELRARVEELELSLTTKLEDGLKAIIPSIEEIVQAVLITSCAIDRVDHAVEQAQRQDRAAARQAIRPEPLPRPEGYTAWQNDARCGKLRARGFENLALAYRAGGFVKARLQDGTVHDTTVQRVGEYLAGKAESPF